MIGDGYMSLSDDELIVFNNETKSSVNKIYDYLRNLGEDYQI